MPKHPLLSKTIIAITAITILTGIALLMGFDGVLLATAISAIAGLGGYTIGRRR